MMCTDIVPMYMIMVMTSPYSIGYQNLALLAILSFVDIQTFPEFLVILSNLSIPSIPSQALMESEALCVLREAD